MVDDTSTNNVCKASAPLSPSSSSSHDRHQSKVPVGRTAIADDPDTPLSLPVDDLDSEGPSSSPPSQLAPSLGSSIANEAEGRSKYESEEVGQEIQRAVDLISRHYHRQLRQDRVEDLECCRVHLDPEAYARLKETLGQDNDLLTHFENDLRHDYNPERHCLKLRLMVTPLHETLKTKFLDEIKSQLSAIASRLDVERDSIRSQLSSFPSPDPQSLSPDLATRAAALEDTVQIIRELEDLSHTTIKLAGGASACPDGQFRHKSRVPHFVFEIGYSEEATSLRQSAEDYINGTYDIKTVVTVDTAYTREQKRKELLRKQRESRRQAAVRSIGEAVGPAQGPGLEQDDEGHTQAQQDRDREREPDAEDENDEEEVHETSGINRCATLCLYRGTRTIFRDMMIRDRHGTAQDGTLVLSLDDFISDKTIKRSEELYPMHDLRPSALLIQISFRQLAAMLEKGDRHQDMQDTTPSPEPELSAGGRAKRKLCLDVDNDNDAGNDNVSTATGVKRRRRILAVGTGPRTRSMVSS